MEILIIISLITIIAISVENSRKLKQQQQKNAEDIAALNKESTQSEPLIETLQEKSRQFYFSNDSLHLLYRIDGHFYLQLSNNHILPCLKSLRLKIQGYEKYLREYPSTLCAPLDLMYIFRRASCTLNEELLQDYLFAYGWREANWGAWLAALAPSKNYAPHLQKSRAHFPHGSVVIDLAISSCTGENIRIELFEHFTLLEEIRDLVATLPRIVSPLRLSPTAEEDKALGAEIELVRSAYRSGGKITALASMQQQKYLKYYQQEHTEWAKDTLHQ